jgi:hypothetical protein
MGTVREIARNALIGAVAASIVLVVMWKGFGWSFDVATLVGFGAGAVVVTWTIRGEFSARPPSLRPPRISP